MNGDIVQELTKLDSGHSDIMPSSRCASCAKCCLSLPGQFFPVDLGQDKDARVVKAKELLTTGLYSIDWYEGDYIEDGEMDQIYHLRPATRTARGVIFDGSWGGACALLGPSGCTIDRADRPTVCKALKPTDGSCNGLTKHDVAIAWRDDSEWLEQLGHEMVPGQ